MQCICAALEHEVNSWHKLHAQPYLATLDTWRQPLSSLSTPTTPTTPTPPSPTTSTSPEAALQQLLRDWTTCGQLPTKGYLVSELMCLTCGNRFSQQPQPFFLLPLNLPAAPPGPRSRLSLLQCLQLLTSMEVIEGVACPRCCLRNSFLELPGQLQRQAVQMAQQQEEQTQRERERESARPVAAGAGGSSGRTPSPQDLASPPVPGASSAAATASTQHSAGCPEHALSSTASGSMPGSPEAGALQTEQPASRSFSSAPPAPTSQSGSRPGSSHGYAFMDNYSLSHPITITPSGSSVSTMTAADWESLQQMQQEVGARAAGGRSAPGTPRSRLGRSMSGVMTAGQQQRQQQEAAGDGDGDDGAGGQAGFARSCSWGSTTEQQLQQQEQQEQEEQQQRQQQQQQEQQEETQREQQEQQQQSQQQPGPSAQHAQHLQKLHELEQREQQLLQQQQAAGAATDSGSSDLALQLLQLSCSRLPLPELDFPALLRRLPGGTWQRSVSSVAKQTAIARAPRTLCLCLQRTGWGADGMPFKYSGHVSFPLMLDITPFTVAGSTAAGAEEEDFLAQYASPAAAGSSPPASPRAAAAAEAARQRGMEYDLVAVVVHLSASSAAGHYVVYVKRRQAAQEQRGQAMGIQPRAVERWYRMSDHSTCEVDLGEVLSCQATLLVYERTGQ
jgi:hypothetical protein